MTHIDNRQSTTANLDVAERLFAAIERGDLDAVRELYAPGCEIWHNNDQHVQTVDQNLRTLSWVVKNIRASATRMSGAKVPRPASSSST
jgi:ketosteroid isomerase-like protein